MSRARIALGAIATLAGAGTFGFVISALQATSPNDDATWLWIGASVCSAAAVLAGAAWWFVGETKEPAKAAERRPTAVRIGDGVKIKGLRMEGNVAVGADLLNVGDKAVLEDVSIVENVEVASQRPPERESHPLEIVGSNHDDKDSTRFLRLQIRNPNDFGVADCYAKVLSCSGAAKETYRGPPVGYHFPWSTYGGNGKIASMSDDYLDIAWVAGMEAKKCAVAYKNTATQKLEAHHMMNRDTYEITMEIGSLTADIPLRRYTMRIVFGGGFDLDITGIHAESTAGTAVGESEDK